MEKGTLGWHPKQATLDLSFALGDSRLVGNGTVPIDLLSIDRTAIFTSPDITKNNMWLTNLEGAYWWNEKIQLTGNFFYRSKRGSSFNGDATPYEECAFSEGEVLVREVRELMPQDEGQADLRFLIKGHLVLQRAWLRSGLR